MIQTPTQNSPLASPIGIALVAPSGYAPDASVLARGVARLEAQGCVVHQYFDPTQKFQRFGDTDAARCQQLVEASQNPSVQIIMAVRGGYGVSRLMQQLDWAQLAASNKLWVGFSDITALHCALLTHQASGCIAGPMFCADFTGDTLSEFTQQQFWQCLHGVEHTLHIAQIGNPVVNTEGPLWGGNLSMLAHLLATPWWPNIRDGILFVEDVGEHPYRIERLFMQLHHAGVLEKQQALILGDFSDYRLSPYDNGYDFDAMLAFLRQRIAIPILTGLPFGHGRDRASLPLGKVAQLRSDAAGFALKMR